MLIRKSKEKKKRQKLIMSATEYTEAMALMDQYQSYSCPICLEDYEVRDGTSSADVNDNGENETLIHYDSFSNKVYLGCDGAPIQLLRCGHSSCNKCWNEWIGTGKDSGLCHVCKKETL